MNAKDYGIPQNRERVFVLSIRMDCDDGFFIFPNPAPLETVAEDFLEDVVDEKYYLKNEKANRLIQSLIERGDLP